MVQRVTYRRRHAYNTKSNKLKIIKTPGGTLTAHYHKKAGTIAKCGDCGDKLRGISASRPGALRTLKKSKRTVSRPYGGSRCATCVRQRILRAFLVEEQRIVKNVLKQRSVAEAKAAKSEKSKKTTQ